VRGGLFPEEITINLVHDLFNKKSPIEYSWEPDGSGKIWHNKEKENRRVPIESVRFDYTVAKLQNDEDPSLINAPTDPRTDRIIQQIALIQTSLVKY
jgi:hypothetical protein